VVAPDQREAVTAEIRSAFASLEHDGAPIFDIVPSASVYRGEAAALAPDLLMVPRSWEIMPFPGLDTDIWCPPTQQAVHRPDGILFARGPGIPAGIECDARIEDVTPLVLAQLGLPVPEDLDGHWLVDPPGPVRREPARRPGPGTAAPLSGEARRLMDDRMRGLGYL
jgi:predicted AlkP superfamily phosphohydrolase/phosphomutase